MFWRNPCVRFSGVHAKVSRFPVSKILDSALFPSAHDYLRIPSTKLINQKSAEVQLLSTKETPTQSQSVKIENDSMQSTKTKEKEKEKEEMHTKSSSWESILKQLRICDVRRDKG